MDPTLDTSCAALPPEGAGAGTPNPRHVLVLGLGASGLAMARWCARTGACVTVADTRDAPPQREALERDVPEARLWTGPFAAHFAGGPAFDAVYLSPGLSPAVTAPVLEAIKAYPALTGGELALFFEALATLRAQTGHAPQVLAVTGTNGKTTVTSLTGQLVERAGKSVAVAGNIGPTLLDTLASHLDAGTLPDVWVLELSSFQLEGAGDFDPTAATVLNLTQDHLDWHGSMAAYGRAKARIFGATGLPVLNRDDAAVMAMLPPPAKGKPPREVVSFGMDVPARPGDFGLETVHGMTWLVRAQDADDTRRSTRSRKPQEAPEIHLQRLMPADALRIRGRHNAANALAALALATAAGCQLAPLLYGLREYRGEPHRVEPIGTVNGVEYFDDSKGTNVGATVAALQGLGAERRIVVILGGDGKGQDFSPLAPAVKGFARAVVLIGRDGPLIADALRQCGVPLLNAASLDDAVQQATAAAQPGDAVLLSPACASFDMFRGYEHRAEVFHAAVRSVAQDAGVLIEGIA